MGKRIIKKTASQSDINVTPLIDIVLVLLIIFMVLTPIMIYELSVNLPDKTETVEQEDDVPKDQLLLAVCKDGTMTLNLGFRAQATLSIPADCLAGLLTCGAYQERINNDPTGPGTWSCRANDADRGCTCNALMEEMPTPREGTWEPLRGLNMRVTLEGDNPDIVMICAEGDTLLIQPPGDEGGPGPVFGLTRQ